MEFYFMPAVKITFKKHHANSEKMTIEVFVMILAHFVFIRAERRREKKMREGPFWSSFHSVQRESWTHLPVHPPFGHTACSLALSHETSPFLILYDLASISTTSLKRCKPSSFLVEFKPFVSPQVPYSLSIICHNRPCPPSRNASCHVPVQHFSGSLSSPLTSPPPSCSIMKGDPRGPVLVVIH